MSQMPLLDGDTIDFDHELDAQPDVEATDSVVLRADFAREQLPWWLDYQTDNGPATPTFDGLISGTDETGVVLNTGTGGSTDDLTAIVSPPISWSQWLEIRCYLIGAKLADPTASVGNLALAGEVADPPTNGFHASFNDVNDPEGIAFNLQSGESSKISYPQPLSERNHIGFRLVDNGGGHNVVWVANGQAIDTHSEAKSN